MNRVCGTCTACCTVMAVLELKKMPYTRCEHCRPNTGCGIYKTKPETCTTYKCSWLVTPGMPKETRPDRIGVLFDKEGLPESVKGYGVAACREVWRGASNGKMAQNILDHIRKDHFVIVIHPLDGKKPRFTVLAPRGYSGEPVEYVDRTQEALDLGDMDKFRELMESARRKENKDAAPV